MPLGLALLGGVTLVDGCAAEPDGTPTTSSQTDASLRAAWGGSARAPITRPRGHAIPPGAGASGSDAGTPPNGADAGTTAPSQDADAIIAAARTPDGSAIPQPAGPNGECPAVVALLGFWSCPTLGGSCTYTANGASHSCLCNRVDGEGQTPAWVCR